MLKIIAWRVLQLAFWVVTACAMTMGTMHLVVETNRDAPFWVMLAVPPLTALSVGAGIASLFNQWTDGVWAAIPVALVVAFASYVFLGFAGG
jgi:Mg2+/citrate symporter